jgi:hypothetical protein
MSASATIRGALVDGADGERINRLAALTGTLPPQGALLLAEMEGEPIAAVGIFDRHAIFDPHRSTFALRMRLHVLRLQIRLIATVYGA